jgi:hypothetical protein
MGHHRKDVDDAALKRIDEHFAKAKEHHDKAEYFRRRTAAAESNVIIFSDDPDATEKLVDKIERLKKRQGVMKRANHLIRKADREGLADLGFSEETVAKLFAQDFAIAWGLSAQIAGTRLTLLAAAFLFCVTAVVLMVLFRISREPSSSSDKTKALARLKSSLSTPVDSRPSARRNFSTSF